MIARLKLELGVVINATDPDKLGRVQVQYEDGVISNWLQVASPFAGPGYGMFSLEATLGGQGPLPAEPEPPPDPNGDGKKPSTTGSSTTSTSSTSASPPAEPAASAPTLALVAFPMDDRTYGYVIGFLFRWDQNASPYIVDDEKKRQSVWLVKTKNGKTITLDDSDDTPSITIADENQNIITFDTKKNEISIVSQGNLTVTATETLTLTGKNVEVQAQEKIKLDASEIDLTAEMEEPPPPPATQPPKTPQPPKAPQ